MCRFVTANTYTTEETTYIYMVHGPYVKIAVTEKNSFSEYKLDICIG